jgi:hypothetical protein
MTSSKPSAAPNPSPAKKRRYLNAEKKFQIYLEAQNSDQPVGELLRREGLFSTDLARIRQQVKEGALQRLPPPVGMTTSVESLSCHSLKMASDAAS